MKGTRQEAPTATDKPSKSKTRKPREKLKPRWYDRRRAAEVRSESVSTIIREEKAGRLTPRRFRPGGKVYYSADEVEAPPQQCA